MSIYCDGMVHVVELHVAVNMAPGEGGQRRFMRPIAAFDDKETAWETAKKGIIPEILNLAKELLEEDEEWNYLTEGIDWDKVTAHVGEGGVYYDHIGGYIDSITVGFTKFEVPMNPAEL